MTSNKGKYILLLTQLQNTAIQQNSAVWNEYCMYTESDLLFNKTNETNRTVPLNPLTPNDHYSGCTAPLTSKCCILYIYSTNIGTAYFKHCSYSLLFSLQNAVCFIILTYLVPVLFTFYIQGVLKLKKIIPAPKG